MASPKTDLLTPLSLPSQISYNKQLDLAVEAMINSRINPATGHTILSNCNAATLYGVSPSTLNARFTWKHQSHEAAHVA
jgi:hypothetical protein